MTKADIFWRANGRATMMLFWGAIAVYTKLTYFS